MESVIKQYGDLTKSALTWIDPNGVRCIADFCYRTKKDDGEIVAVVTERHDNAGMSVTNSAAQVTEAVLSRFPLHTKIHLNERYDCRSYANWTAMEPARYAKILLEGRTATFQPIHKDVAAFLDAHWDDIG